MLIVHVTPMNLPYPERYSCSNESVMAGRENVCQLCLIGDDLQGVYKSGNFAYLRADQPPRYAPTCTFLR